MLHMPRGRTASAALQPRSATRTAPDHTIGDGIAVKESQPLGEHLIFGEPKAPGQNPRHRAIVDTCPLTFLPPRLGGAFTTWLW